MCKSNMDISKFFPDFRHPFITSYYYFDLSQGRSWSEARLYCQQKHARLVKFETREEYFAVVNYMSNYRSKLIHFTINNMFINMCEQKSDHMQCYYHVLSYHNFLLLADGALFYHIIILLQLFIIIFTT